jgi:hypothetical protein
METMESIGKRNYKIGCIILAVSIIVMIVMTALAVYEGGFTAMFGVFAAIGIVAFIGFIIGGMIMAGNYTFVFNKQDTPK